MDLREVGWWDVDWIHLAQDGDKQAVVITVMNTLVPCWLSRRTEPYEDSSHSPAAAHQSCGCVVMASK
jgi:hypothetical protein